MNKLSFKKLQKKRKQMEITTLLEAENIKWRRTEAFQTKFWEIVNDGIDKELPNEEIIKKVNELIDKEIPKPKEIPQKTKKDTPKAVKKKTEKPTKEVSHLKDFQIEAYKTLLWSMSSTQLRSQWKTIFDKPNRKKKGEIIPKLIEYFKYGKLKT